MIDGPSWRGGAEAMREDIRDLLLDVARTVGPATQVRLLGLLADRLRLLPIPMPPTIADHEEAACPKSTATPRC